MRCLLLESPNLVLRRFWRRSKLLCALALAQSQHVGSNTHLPVALVFIIFTFVVIILIGWRWMGGGGSIALRITIRRQSIPSLYISEVQYFLGCRYLKSSPMFGRCVPVSYGVDYSSSSAMWSSSLLPSTGSSPPPSASSPAVGLSATYLPTTIRTGLSIGDLNN